MSADQQALTECTGFVLAGGQSSRMGHDKSLALFAGQPLIAHALGILQQAGLKAAIAGARPGTGLARFAQVIPDQAPNQGPLGGILSALTATISEYTLFLPVDMPLIPPSLLEHMLHRAQLTGAPVTIFRLNGHLQPFPVLLHHSVTPLIRARLHSGQSGCQSAWQAIPAALNSQLDAPHIEHLVQAGHVRYPSAHPPTHWFESANTPAALDYLNRLQRFRATSTTISDTLVL